MRKIILKYVDSISKLPIIRNIDTMKVSLIILTIAVFTGCSMPNKKVEPTQDLLYIYDTLARKPIVIFTEKDYC